MCIDKSFIMNTVILQHKLRIVHFDFMATSKKILQNSHPLQQKHRFRHIKHLSEWFNR